MSGGRSLSAVAAAVGLLSACTVGPDYRPPAPIGGAPPPARFAGQSAAASSAEPPDRWWRLYQDPRLDRLVALALTSNTDLRVAAANLEQADAVLAEARARRLPSTSLDGGIGYGVSTPALTAFDVEAVHPRPDAIFQAGVDVSWELDLFGRIRRAVDAARADAQASEAARDAVRVVVAAETARAFVEACAYGQAAEVQDRSLAISEQLARLTEDRRRAGAASSYETVRARAATETTRAALPELQAERRAAIFRLAVLTGRPPEAVLQEAENCTAPPTLADPLPVGDGRALLARRPEVREAERRLAAATARIGVATADLYPTISLGGSFAAISPTLAGLGAAANRTWSVGPLLSWTFPNRSAARARIAEAEARTRASLADFDGVVLEALSDVEQALVREAAELDRVQALRAARGRDASALTVARDRYRAGAIDFLDLVDVERSLISDDAALASAERILADDQVAVFKALGGGWSSVAEGS